MEFNQVVMSRRSVFKFQNRSVLSSDILELCTAAIMAPNHGLTQPWKFVVVGSKTQDRLAHYYAQARATKYGTIGSDAFVVHRDRAFKRFKSIPAIVMVTCCISADLVVNEENYAASCCAVQNMLLAATNKGLGSQWSTHPMIRDESVLRELLLDPLQDRVVAMVYLGYPDVVPPSPPRGDISAFLTRLP